MSRASPRVAVVHEWLLDYAGSERVLREILEVLPNADLFTLIAHTASGICTFKYIGPNATGSVNGTPVTFTNGSMWNWTSSDIVCVTINPPNLPCCYQVPC